MNDVDRRTSHDCFVNGRKKVRGRDYSRLEEMVQDYYRIFENCELYNEPGSVIVKEAMRLRRRLDKWISQNSVADDKS